MTPSEIETAARRQYNAVGDSAFAQAEIFDLIYQAQLELAMDVKVIHQTHSVTTTTGTQGYTFPTNTIAIKRVTYNGSKLHPISMREDDALTLNNSATTAQGSPQYYYQWGDQVYLRPIPDAAETLKFYTYDQPSVVTANTTLETPSRYHMGIVNYVVSEMFAKDLNLPMSRHYLEKWNQTKQQAKVFERKRQTGDSFKAVVDEESLPTTILGTV